MVRHSSRIYLSQSSLTNNINFIRKKLKEGTTLSAVVKANAYGHGIPEFTKMLEKAGVNHFSVASAFEAYEVHEHCSKDSTIMIMGILYHDDLEWVIENEIEFYVFDSKRLPKILEVAKKVGKKAKLHLELETGTNRTGMLEEEFFKVVSWVKKNQEFVSFEGICTHLGGAENRNNEFKILPQIDKFMEVTKKLKKKKYEPTYRHMACSAAALMYPETQLDMVRIGVAVYGFWPSPDVYYHHQMTSENPKGKTLKRIITWKTDVMDIKHIKAGEFVGYGTAFQASKDMKLAVLPLGYSNGYTRGLSNRGFVLIRGLKAPIVGLINMNLFMVDVSHIPDVAINDEVVLLGRQKNNLIKVSSFTEYTQLLNNEMLSRLPAAIPRYVVR